MDQFPSAGHLASWTGMCSGNRESLPRRPLDLVPALLPEVQLAQADPSGQEVRPLRSDDSRLQPIGERRTLVRRAVHYPPPWREANPFSNSAFDTVLVSWQARPGLLGGGYYPGEVVNAPADSGPGRGSDSWASGHPLTSPS
jgi:hypothetical protein